jgi:hypothetical protein
MGNFNQYLSLLLELDSDEKSLPWLEIFTAFLPRNCQNAKEVTFCGVCKSLNPKKRRKKK